MSGVRSDLSRLLLCLVVLGALAVARGRIETEGNLGRTDLFLSLGGGHSLPPFGALSASVEVPLASEATGEQVDIPVIVSLQWSR